MRPGPQRHAVENRVCRRCWGWGRVRRGAWLCSPWPLHPRPPASGRRGLNPKPPGGPRPCSPRRWGHVPAPGSLDHAVVAGWQARAGGADGRRAPWPGRRARASAGQPHTPCAMAGCRACAAGVPCTRYAEAAVWGPTRCLGRARDAPVGLGRLAGMAATKAALARDGGRQPPGPPGPHPRREPPGPGPGPVPPCPRAEVGAEAACPRHQRAAPWHRRRGRVPAQWPHRPCPRVRAVETAPSRREARTWASRPACCTRTAGRRQEMEWLQP